MKLSYLGAIATSIIIVIGVVMTLGPAYMHMLEKNRSPPVMLSFYVVNGSGVSAWCNDLSSILERQQVRATVFVTGMIADQHPDCITALASVDGIDIGSQTYSYVNLTSVDDYLEAQDEVKNGKLAVDRAGNIDSRLFRAPFGSTDQNIYSLLSNSHIVADFSYESQYNKFENGQFVKYDLVTCNCTGSSPDKVRELLESGHPVMITSSNETPVSEIQSLVSELKSDDEIEMVNASDLTGLELTVKEGSSA